MTETNRCPIDNRSLRNDAQICDECARQTRIRLAAIPPMYIQAGAYLEPGRGGFGSSGSERTIGVNLAALGFRHAGDLLGVLTAWVEFVIEERELAPTKFRGDIQDRVGDSCAFLLRHADWLIQSDLASDWYNEIYLIHREGLAATRNFLEKVTRIKCPTSLEEFDASGEQIAAKYCGQLLTLSENVLDEIECKRCKNIWTTLRLVAVAMSKPDNVVWMDSQAIAVMLGVSPRYVQVIAKTYNAKRRGLRGDQVYDLIEMAALREKIRHAANE